MEKENGRGKRERKDNRKVKSERGSEPCEPVPKAWKLG
jgi:hypothetical protein